jgi:hypothetical protein
MRKTATLAALAALLAACGDGGLVDPGAFTLTGSWSGTTGPYTFVFDLQQSGGDVSGTGEVTVPANPDEDVPAGTLDLAVSGSWDEARVELELSAPGFQETVYAGQFVRSDSVAGTLNGSGFSNTALSITRLPEPVQGNP